MAGLRIDGLMQISLERTQETFVIIVSQERHTERGRNFTYLSTHYRLEWRINIFRWSTKASWRIDFWQQKNEKKNFYYSYWYMDPMDCHWIVKINWQEITIVIWSNLPESNNWSFTQFQTTSHLTYCNTSVYVTITPLLRNVGMVTETRWVSN